MHKAITTEVVPGRLELPTSTLSVWRSNQLSYRTELEESLWCFYLTSFSLILNNSVSEYKKKNEPKVLFYLLITVNLSTHILKYLSTY